MKLKSPEYRILVATILLIYCMVTSVLDSAISSYTSNETVLIAFIGFASGLLGVGIIKQHKNFREDDQIEMEEEE